MKSENEPFRVFRRGWPLGARWRPGKQKTGSGTRHAQHRRSENMHPPTPAPFTFSYVFLLRPKVHPRLPTPWRKLNSKKYYRTQKTIRVRREEGSAPSLVRGAPGRSSIALPRASALTRALDSLSARFALGGHGRDRGCRSSA